MEKEKTPFTFNNRTELPEYTNMEEERAPFIFDDQRNTELPQYTKMDKERAAFDNQRDTELPQYSDIKRVESSFKNILEDAKPPDFFSLRDYESVSDPHKFPTVQEATAHLLLFKAFDRLYNKVTSHIKEEEDKVNPWKIYVTNAVRRFIIFLNAFKCLRKLDSLHKPFDGDLNDEDILNMLPDDDYEYFQEFEKKYRRKPNALRGLLPPLDIILVWHAFLLNPTSFYDNCMRNGLQDFALTSFPLDRIAKAIDWDTFDYCPDEKQRMGFDKLMKDAGVISLYEVDLGLLIRVGGMYVYCPICCKLLEYVPLTVHDFTAKDIFARRACTCKGFEGECLSHNNLRRRQLIADIYAEKERLPCIYKYYSSVLEGNLTDEMQINKIDYLVKQYLRERVESKILQDMQSPLEDTFLELTKYTASLKKGELMLLNTKCILRNYLQMNLIHTTIPPMKHNVKISEDLVGCVLRQQKFVDKMNTTGRLFSPMLGEALSESSVRYIRFISMLNSSKGKFPTLDIDLMWHTHLLSPFDYLDYFRKEGKKVVDHDDKIEGCCAESDNGGPRFSFTKEGKKVADNGGPSFPGRGNCGSNPRFAVFNFAAGSPGYRGEGGGSVNER